MKVSHFVSMHKFLSVVVILMLTLIIKKYYILRLVFIEKSIGKLKSKYMICDDALLIVKNLIKHIRKCLCKAFLNEKSSMHFLQS